MLLSRDWRRGEFSIRRMMTRRDDGERSKAFPLDEMKHKHLTHERIDLHCLSKHSREEALIAYRRHSRKHTMLGEAFNGMMTLCLSKALERNTMLSKHSKGIILLLIAAID